MQRITFPLLLLGAITLAGCSGGTPADPPTEGVHHLQVDCPTLLGVTSSDSEPFTCDIFHFGAVFDVNRPSEFGEFTMVWDFGGGATQLGGDQYPVVLLGEPGEYEGTVTATFSCGETSIPFEFEVLDRNVVATIDSASASISGRLMADASSSTAAAPIDSYTWVFDYGDDPSEFETPDAITGVPALMTAHSYPYAGTFTLGVQVASRCQSDIATFEVEVLDARTPFTNWPTITTAASGVTGLVYGSDNQDWQNLIVANQVGGDNFLALGDNLYTTFWGNAGSGMGLYIVKSLNGGSTWGSPVRLTAATSNGGSSIAGVVDNGSDVVHVAFGSTQYVLPLANANVKLFTNTNAGSSDSWSTTTIDSYTATLTLNAACDPALAVNPKNASELHLAYGTSTGGVTGGITRRVRIKSSTGGASGLASASAIQLDAGLAGAPDKSWWTDAGSLHSMDMVQHPISEAVYLSLGCNRHTYVLQSTDHGSSWTKPLSSYSPARPWHRDGDLALDPYDPNVYYVARVIRGNTTHYLYDTNGVVVVLKGEGTSLTAIAEPRAASETAAGTLNSFAAHPTMVVHPTGELELYWTEADGSGLLGFMNSPHIQGDVLNWGASSWSNDPDLIIGSGLIPNPLQSNPSVELADGGGVHVLWGNSGDIKHRQG